MITATFLQILLHFLLLWSATEAGVHVEDLLGFVSLLWPVVVTADWFNKNDSILWNESEVPGAEGGYRRFFHLCRWLLSSSCLLLRLDEEEMWVTWVQGDVGAGWCGCRVMWVMWGQGDVSPGWRWVQMAPLQARRCSRWWSSDLMDAPSEPLCCVWGTENRGASRLIQSRSTHELHPPARLSY